MLQYRWRHRFPGSQWVFVQAIDADTIKAKIPAEAILEVQCAGTDRWVAVVDAVTPIPIRIGPGSSVAVRGPDGTIYPNILEAAKSVGVKYALIRHWVNGDKQGWRRAKQSDLIGGQRETSRFR